MSGIGSRWLSGLAPWAVIDTSALISAHRHALWALAHDRYFYGIWNPFIIGEMVRIRLELAIKHGQARDVYRQTINDLVHALSAVLHSVPYSDAMRSAISAGVGGLLVDPDDDPVLASALVGRADFVVSLNTREFPPGGSILSVRYVTPWEFFAILESHYPHSPVTRIIESTMKRVP